MPWDVTGAFFRAFEANVEERTPEHGRAPPRADSPAEHRTDPLGDLHDRPRRPRPTGLDRAEEALARLDGLLAGLLADLPADVTLLLTSDHGNLEERHHTSHTRNPVPLLALGPQAAAFAELTRIDEIAPRILELLG